MGKLNKIVPDILYILYIVPYINICYNLYRVKELTLIYWSGGGCSDTYRKGGVNYGYKRSDNVDRTYHLIQDYSIHNKISRPYFADRAA